ncbi:MAG: hypothetical protein WDO14_08910 [Bacteroidota bacterium]
MKCQEILTVLVSYRDKVAELLSAEQSDVIVSSGYSFIIVNIDRADIDLTFEVTDKSSKLIEIFPPDPGLQTMFGSQQWPELKASPTQHPWSNEIIKNLETADNIASLAVNCTTGDNYGPGNFSKILLSSHHIELQQVNYMNAKSLDHKDDYSLRSLVFRIPLSGNTKMITEFTDRSSQNNRECGERIKAALDWTA